MRSANLGSPALLRKSARAGRAQPSGYELPKRSRRVLPALRHWAQGAGVELAYLTVDPQLKRARAGHAFHHTRKLVTARRLATQREAPVDGVDDLGLAA